MDLGFTLDNNEVVIHKVNRHWIALAPVVISSGGLVVAVIALAYLLSRYGDQLPQGVSAIESFGILGGLLALAALMLTVGIWVYRRNFMILTNQHLIRVEQRGLFTRSVSQLSLSRVQDVNGTTPGFLATIFGFGNVTVETAGEEENFVFLTVSNPTQLAKECLQAHEQYAVQPAAPANPANPINPVSSADAEL